MRRLWLPASVLSLILSTSLAGAMLERSSASAQSAPTDAGAHAVTGGSVLRRWASTMGGSQVLTAAQAVADAQTVDLIVARPVTFAPYTAQMRAANPALKIIYYFNGVYATGGTRSIYPESWYLHDASGARVWSTSFANYLMDPVNPDWIQSRIDDCSATMASTGWDGCYLDMLGPGALTEGHTSEIAINPATGVAWTTPDWITATTHLAATVTAAVPTGLIVGNGLGDGNQYFSPSWGPTSTLFGGFAAGNAQGFVRGSFDPATQFRLESRWMADVDMLIDAGSRAKAVMAQAKVWDTAATQVQKDALHRYALATFLLGADGRQYWYWSDTGSESAIIEDTSYDHVNIGVAVGSYAKMNGVYQRRFSGGLVAVNPTAVPLTMSLGSGQWTTLAGTTVQGQFTLAANTGDVLTTAAPWGPVPTVVTKAATNITPTSATLPAAVNANGLATSVTADYGTDTTLGSVSVSVAAGSGTSATTVPVILTGLKPGTTYTYHGTARNSAGTTAGTNLTFRTPLPAPNAITNGAVAINTSQATINGSVDPNGLATTYHFDFGPTTSYTKTTPVVAAGMGTTLTAVSATLSGLTAGEVIHYRVEATNSTGTTYGGDRSFAMPKPPGAATGAATVTSGPGATLTGTVAHKGTDAQYWFEWGPTISYGTSTPVGSDSASGPTKLPVSANVTGLTAATTYHYRLVAANPSGTTNGRDKTFTT